MSSWSWTRSTPSLQWRHNGRDGVSNYQPHHWLLNRLFGRRWKKTSKLRVTGLCAGNSLGTGEFPGQMVSNAENVSIWWRHHVLCFCREAPLLTQFNYNPNHIDKWLHPSYGVWWNYLSNPKLQREWISNFITHFTGHVIIHAGIRVNLYHQRGSPVHLLIFFEVCYCRDNHEIAPASE